CVKDSYGRGFDSW
nr:immunoglobulin heavy chain junction region [Macaca mulatta]MOX68792.1 immunoglobulin heavy chain junction region [Macaca mulatta]